MIIVVTGLMRTGTSLIARQLHELGCPMGTMMRFPIMRDNAQLDYEDVDFTDKCLAATKGSVTSARLKVFFNQYIRRREGAFWGVKSPFLYPYVDLFKAEAQVPVKVVVTRRSVPETFKSIERQTSMVEPIQIQKFLLSWPEPEADLIIPIEQSWHEPYLVREKLIKLIKE